MALNSVSHESKVIRKPNVDESAALSQNTDAIPLKDLFFIGDLEKYYKYGKVPYVLFLHTFLLVLTTSIILLSLDDLSLFRLHIRAIDTAFVPEYDALNYLVTGKNGFLIPDIKCLNNHIDASIKVIYNFPEKFTHNLTLRNLNSLKMYIHYHQSSYLNHSNYEFDIKNGNDNPLKKMTDSAKFRTFLSHVKYLKVPLTYEMNVKNYRGLRLLWTTFLIYDFNNRGFIKFYLTHEFKLIKEYTSVLNFIKTSLVFEFGVLNILIIIFSAFEIGIIFRRIYSGFTALMKVKSNLNKVQNFSDEESVFNEDKEYYFANSRTKWEMLQLNEKRKFFNLWYIIILISNLFQVVSSVNHILYPVLNNTNQILCATSCMMTWFGCGYFLEYEDKYYFFYLTIKKSMKSHFKYIVVFILIFCGYGVLLTCTFNYSENFYSSIQMAFMTNFAGLVGDNVAAIWRSTFWNDPVKTISFAFFYFLMFVAFLLRMLMTITEESFDCIKMRKNYYWLDQKISVRDYIQHEIGHKGEETADHLHEEGHSVKNHYMMSNAIMNIIMLIERDKNKLPPHLEEMFKFRIAQLKQGGLDDEAVSAIVKKELKRLIKDTFGVDNTSTSIRRKDSSQDITKIELKLGKTESVKMHFIYELVDGILEEIENSFTQIGDLRKKNKIQNEKLKFSLSINENISAYIDKVLIRLSKIKKAI